MTGTNSERSVSRRSVLKRSAGALAVGGGLAAESAAAAREGSLREAVTCGDGHPEGSALTVAQRCDDDCDTVRLNGLSPTCDGGTERLYVNLPGTEPTVWMDPRDGEIPPGRYRVERAERCEPGAGECDGADLYRLALRPVGG